MRRITVRIDCKDGDVERIKEEVKSFLESCRVSHTILRVYDDLVVSEVSY